MNSDDVSTTSKEEGKKNSKPIMEKRRRARINACLAELKSLLVDVIKSEGSIHSKMEKADILETTVRHLRRLQNQPLTGSLTSVDTSLQNKFGLGYAECINEVGRFLQSSNSEEIDLKAKLIDHLANCTTRLRAANVEHGSLSLPVGSRCTTTGRQLYTSTMSISDDVGIERNLDQSSESTQLHIQKEIRILPKADPSCKKEETTHSILQEFHKRIIEHERKQTSSNTTMDADTETCTSTTTETKETPTNTKCSEINSLSLDEHKQPVNKYEDTVIKEPFQMSKHSTLSNHPTVQCNQTIPSFPTSLFSSVQIIPATISGREYAFVLPANITTNLYAAVTAPSYVLPIYTQQALPSSNLESESSYNQLSSTIKSSDGADSCVNISESRSDTLATSTGSAFSAIMSSNLSETCHGPEGSIHRSGYLPRVNPYDLSKRSSSHSLGKQHTTCNISTRLLPSATEKDIISNIGIAQHESTPDQDTFEIRSMHPHDAQHDTSNTQRSDVERARNNNMQRAHQIQNPGICRDVWRPW